ncbi:MAG: hypothetical protein CL910_18230 [Deltaproteobacteria bacterium]|nr:hypothetical protein [Deltaproteobacteria bacterium]
MEAVRGVGAGEGRLARLRAVPGAKAAWLCGMAVFICVPYFGLQQGPWREPWLPPVTALDRAVAFDPRWLLPYLSIVVLVPLFPMLAERREEVAHYVLGIVLLALPCFVCFALWPVAGPRPEHSAGDLHAWLVGVDRTWNSMPSLHAALASYSGLYGWHLLQRRLSQPARASLAIGLTAWVGVILYATLATKQHWALDLPPAIALGVLAHAAMVRSSLARPSA